MVMLIIGLLVAFCVYNDAKKRGSGAIAAMLWSAGSAVAPYAFVVLPLYLIFGRKAKRQDQYYNNDVIDIEATVVEETMSCTRCGNKVDDDALVCPYCQQPTSISNKDNL